MEEFSDVRSKERAVIELLTVEKIAPIEIHRRMQAVYGDQCVDVSTVIPRLTKIFRSVITFVSRNVISRRFL